MVFEGLLPWAPGSEIIEVISTSTQFGYQPVYDLHNDCDLVRSVVDSSGTLEFVFSAVTVGRLITLRFLHVEEIAIVEPDYAMVENETVFYAVDYRLDRSGLGNFIVATGVREYSFTCHEVVMQVN